MHLRVLHEVMMDLPDRMGACAALTLVAPQYCLQACTGMVNTCCCLPLCRAARPRVRLNRPQAAALKAWISKFHTGDKRSVSEEDAQLLLGDASRAVPSVYEEETNSRGQ